MTENTGELGIKADPFLAEWGVPFQAVVCESCDWSFLGVANELESVCPHCFQASLVRLEGDLSALTHQSAPELILPFDLQETRLEEKIQEFVRGIPFPPADLRATNLQSRFKRVYLPVWLVDVNAKSNWQAEMGFNYQVVSHQERYEQNQGNWQTQQVEENRTRWEPRVGSLDRSYTNLPAPAMENDAQIRKTIGKFNFQSSQNYTAMLIGKSLVRLPDRSKQDAWRNILPDLQSIAADECRKACDADHVRQFSWSPVFADQHWTLLLEPVFATYYLDDSQKPQPVMINGQSGQVFGARRASLNRAKQVSIYILLAALFLFIISLGSLVLTPLTPLFAAISAIGTVIAFAVALAALIPVISVWWFNRSQDEL